jgi:hypothetical protein
MAKATPYDPKNLATTSGITTQYVTNTAAADGFQRAYPLLLGRDQLPAPVA